MIDTSIYQNISKRTDGAFLLGVVGPVRTGKSTFIKRFMETTVIPRIVNEYVRERAIDELPQSGAGKTIMTAEPKFIPEEAVKINFAENTELIVRLVDCVGYMVDGVSGQFEDGNERMVTTPWFENEVTLTEAAEKGTEKVIREHSTVGIVVTADSSICDIPREKYIIPEERVINELKEIGKPFIVLLNTTDPQNINAVNTAAEIAQKNDVICIPINCRELNEDDIERIMQLVLEEFPLKAVKVYMPEWVTALPDSSELKSALYHDVYSLCREYNSIHDCIGGCAGIKNIENVENVVMSGTDLGKGFVNIRIDIPRAVYYKTISEETGLDVKNDTELLSMLSEMGAIRADYIKLKNALESVRQTGYGVVIPDSTQMQLEEPKIVRQGGKYTVKLKANAPAIHMIMTDIETEVSPAIGGETASEDILNFLLQGFDGDMNKIWQSNIFGKSLYDIAEEGLTTKIESLPENVKLKLRDTLQRMINESCGGLICILL